VVGCNKKAKSGREASASLPGYSGVEPVVEKESFWWYITLETKNGNEETLASLADLSGSIGSEVFEGNGRIALRAYYRSHFELGYWLKRVGEVLKAWPEISVRDMGKIENQAWHTAWKDAFPPLEVGRNFVVMAPWHKGSEPAGRTVLYIYPGSAFGTGYHESTQIVLELLEGCLRPGMETVDVGTGSAILAIGAVKLGAVKVWARDIDPAVLAEAAENCRLNGIEEGMVQVEQGDLLKGFERKVDLLTANIVIEPLLVLLPDVRAALRPGGMAIFSGLVRKERESFLEALRQNGLEMLSELEKGDWWGVSAQVAP
jgi:ribosomal protein L11 methyltransferase